MPKNLAVTSSLRRLLDAMVRAMFGSRNGSILPGDEALVVPIEERLVDTRRL